MFIIFEGKCPAFTTSHSLGGAVICGTSVLIRYCAAKLAIASDGATYSVDQLGVYAYTAVSVPEPTVMLVASVTSLKPSPIQVDHGWIVRVPTVEPYAGGDGEGAAPVQTGGPGGVYCWPSVDQ